MSYSLNLSLTHEMRAYVAANCGEGTRYATPSEFIGDVLWQRKLQDEAAQIGQGILDGYQDAIAGRITPFEGDLRAVLQDSRE